MKDNKRQVVITIIGLIFTFSCFTTYIYSPNPLVEMFSMTIKGIEIHPIPLICFVYFWLFMLALGTGGRPLTSEANIYLLYIALLILLAIGVFIEIAAKNPESGTSGNILKSVAITLTTFGFIITGFSVAFAHKVKKIEELIEYAKDSPKMATISAELAFHSLPDFSESHQIPERLFKVLKQICDKVFFPESPLLRHLEEAGNGATLHYANGLYAFSKGDYPSAIRNFKEIEGLKSANIGIKNAALYRLGITFRQEGRYLKSVDYFMKLYHKDIRNKEARLQAEYGIALTLYAIEKDRSQPKTWRNKRDKILKLIEDIEVSSPKDSTTAENLAFEILSEVVSIQRNNYSAILYLAKIYISNPAWFNHTRTIDSSELKRLVKELLRFLKTVPDSLNIRANYMVVETNCYLCLSKMEPSNAEYGEKAQASLTSALFMTEEYEKFNNNATIFSDEQVRQISANDFRNEILNIALNNSIDLPVIKSIT